MRWFLLLVGLVGFVAYAFIPPRAVPEVRPGSVKLISGPLRTSWGATLQDLRQGPSVAQNIVSSRKDYTQGSRTRFSEADRYLEVGGSERDPFEQARRLLTAYTAAPHQPPVGRSQAPKTELWVMGQTNGWVQPKEANIQAAEWAPYVASVEDFRFSEPVADTTEKPSAKAASTGTMAPLTANLTHAVAAAPKPPSTKSRVGASDDIAAEPRRPRGLFTTNDDGRRRHGLFGLFRGRKAERPAWSIGPTG